MRSGSQSLFYTHDYPLKEEEFDEVAEDANLGTGVYLYFMDQNDETVISFENIRRYLSVTFVDGTGDKYGAVICSEQANFAETKLASDPEKSILQSSANVATAIGLICPSAEIVNYNGLSLQISLCHSEDPECISETSSGQEFINSIVAVTKLFTRKVDFTKKSEFYYNADYYTGYFSLIKASNGRNVQYVQKIDLQLNQVEMYDGMMNMNKASRDFYLGFGSSNQYQVTNTGGVIVQQKFSVSDIAVKHNRRSFTFWMWLALVGGVTQSLLLAFNWIVSPFAKFGFQLRAAKRLYWARTSDDKLFLEKPEDKIRYRRDFDEFGQNPFEDEVSRVGPEQEQEVEEAYEGGRRASQGSKVAGSRGQKYYQEDLSQEYTKDRSQFGKSNVNNSVRSPPG